MILYEVAPLTRDQVNVGVAETPVAPFKGPLKEGAGSNAAGVWKYSTVVKVDSPAELPAATFHLYALPAVNVAE
jgi:hypothetical protein